MAENPEKFKNVKFIPGVELSFSHKVSRGNNPCEISEILAYGINPFKFDKYCENLQKRRNDTIDNMLLEIKDISQLQALLSDFGCPVEMLTPFESYNSLCIHDGGDK